MGYMYFAQMAAQVSTARPDETAGSTNGTSCTRDTREQQQYGHTKYQRASIARAQLANKEQLFF